MILFWMKAFKKPNRQQDAALREMYLMLTDKNQKKLNKRNLSVIFGYLAIALICLIVTVAIMTSLLIDGEYNAFGLGFDIAFILLSLYAVFTSCSWFTAKPYQRILISMDYAQKLYNSQDNSVPTESQIVDEMVTQTQEQQNQEAAPTNFDKENKK